MLTDNYLELEELITARWREQMTELRAVIPIADLPDITELKQPSPVGFVYYDGDDIAGSVQRGASQTVDQRWALVIAVRNVRDIKSGGPARADAGPLIKKTIKTFAGWQPGPGYKPMHRLSGPGPAYRAGYAYFPLLFAVRLFT